MMPAVRPRLNDEGAYIGSGGPRHAADDAASGRGTGGVGRTNVPLRNTRMPAVGGAFAGAELADRLRQAWIRAGRPHMGVIGYEVGYSKATISKVLSGKMPPAWHLVRKLGVVLGVPGETVADEWHALWIAADNFRRGVSECGPAGRAARNGGQTCQRCGSWVVHPHLHAAWHLRVERDAAARATGRVPDPDRISDSHEWANLRDAVSRRTKS